MMKMKFQNKEQVKHWFRSLPVLTHELKLKIDFYTELSEIVAKMRDEKRKKDLAFYLEQIDILREQLLQVSEDADQLMACLDPDERLVITAKYLRRMSWDSLECKLYYSRRQAFRIQARAFEKMLNHEVKELIAA